MLHVASLLIKVSSTRVLLKTSCLGLMVVMGVEHSNSAPVVVDYIVSSLVKQLQAKASTCCS